jgi:hypothetical protein
MDNRQFAENQAGFNGSEFINDALQHNALPNWFYCNLIFTAATVIAAITPAPTGNTLVGTTIAAGVIIPGKFTSITLTSGSLIAIKGM